MVPSFGKQPGNSSSDKCSYRRPSSPLLGPYPTEKNTCPHKHHTRIFMAGCSQWAKSLTKANTKARAGRQKAHMVGDSLHEAVWLGRTQTGSTQWLPEVEAGTGAKAQWAWGSWR